MADTTANFSHEQRTETRLNDTMELDVLPDTEPPSDGDTLPSDVPRRPGLIPDDNENLSPVTFRPLVLRNWMLALCLVFHLVCIALVAVAAFVSEWQAESLWTYAFLIILPYVLGTTSAIWKTAPSIASRSIFQHCFPVPSMWDARHNWFLYTSHVIWWLTVFLVPLKASLLVTYEDELEFWVTHWAAYALLSIHTLVSVHIIGILIYLRDKKTGLREDWDTVTMADHMALFRHSDFLHLFAGTGGAERSSILNKKDSSLSTLRIKLGYWKLSDTGQTWYGFGIAPRDAESKGALMQPQNPDSDASLEFSREHLDKMSKASVFSFVNPRSLIFQVIFWQAFVMAGAYIAALVMGLKRNNEDTGNDESIGNDESVGRNQFIVPITTELAAVVFVLIPITLLSTFHAFWSDAALFAAVTQPFVGMREPGGRPAQDTIMLDYVCLSNADQVMAAAKNKHWKVALTGVAKALHRLLPNLAGPSVMIGRVDGHRNESIVSVNIPLVAIVSLWLVMELFLMPWVAMTGVETRPLPRDYLCIADLLSWTCMSEVLTPQDSNNDPFADPLHISVETVPANGPAKGQGQKEDMEARLRLSGKHYLFGVVPAEGNPGKYMIGIGFGDSEGLANEGQLLSLLGAEGFVMVAGAEGTITNAVAANLIRAQKAPEEERIMGEGEEEET